MLWCVARTFREGRGSCVGQKKAAVIAYRCWSARTQNLLNGLFYLFIQQLWNNIGSTGGKFTSFYRS